MSKYQEAWGNIKTLAMTSDFFKHSQFSDDFEDLSIIQKLVEKEIPKNPLLNEFDFVICPNGHCGTDLERYSIHDAVRCNQCGQKIDWSHEVEFQKSKK